MHPTVKGVVKVQKITVKRAAQLLGKSELFVRECIKNGSLPIGTATQLPGSSRWAFSISPKLLADYLGCSVSALYEGVQAFDESSPFTEEQISYLMRKFERMLREGTA